MNYSLFRKAEVSDTDECRRDTPPEIDTVEGFSARGDEQRWVIMMEQEFTECFAINWSSTRSWAISKCVESIPEPEADIHVYQYEKYETAFVSDVMWRKRRHAFQSGLGK